MREIIQVCWTNSFPATSDAFGRFQSVTVAPNESALGIDFGNFERTSIHGYKFNDLNGNGLDNSDPRLAGWPIAIVGTDGQGNPVSTSTVTGVGEAGNRDDIVQPVAVDIGNCYLHGQTPDQQLSLQIDPAAACRLHE